MERSFDNDELDVTYAGEEESKGDSPMVDVTNMILHVNLRRSTYLMMGMRQSRLYGCNAERANGHCPWKHSTRTTACATGTRKPL